MLLPFSEGLVRTTPADHECAALADRHYSRVRHGTSQFTRPARKIILRDALGLVLFAWTWDITDEIARWDGESGYNCAIFRNESSRLSSEIILEAEARAISDWGPGRAFTYIDPTKIKSRNPGYCFKIAGWQFVRTSKNGKHLLEKALL